MKKLSKKFSALLFIEEQDNAWKKGVSALTEKELKLLVQLIQNEEERLASRKQAVEILAYRKGDVCRDALIKLLKSPEPMIRAKAADALSRFGLTDKNISKNLIKGLKDTDYFVRECCAKTLCLRYPNVANRHLSKMAKDDPHSYNRRLASKLIDTMKEQGIEEAN